MVPVLVSSGPTHVAGMEGPRGQHPPLCHCRAGRCLGTSWPLILQEARPAFSRGGLRAVSHRGESRSHSMC